MEVFLGRILAWTLLTGMIGDIWGSYQLAYGDIVGYNGDTYDVRELITNNINAISALLVQKWLKTLDLRQCERERDNQPGDFVAPFFSSRCSLGDQEPRKACWNSLKWPSESGGFQGDDPGTTSVWGLDSYRTSGMVLLVVLLVPCLWVGQGKKRTGFSSLLCARGKLQESCWWLQSILSLSCSKHHSTPSQNWPWCVDCATWCSLTSGLWSFDATCNPFHASGQNQSVLSCSVVLWHSLSILFGLPSP